ncbi:unnamed protein product [Soboliphyme baturini]|uniref:Secreted protein n=1 Tax=Soboliphyme baturini TaxID=241478 RepID=A0A183IKL7_9BILA|nr:unnamed protein product [Soboliphyme baturini]
MRSFWVSAGQTMGGRQPPLEVVVPRDRFVLALMNERANASAVPQRRSPTEVHDDVVMRTNDDRLDGGSSSRLVCAAIGNDDDDDTINY